MDLENISLKYREGFSHDEIKGVYKAIDKLPLKIGANVQTSMEIFRHGDSIGICPQDDKVRINCDDLNALPQNYKSKLFLEVGGNTAQIWITEYDTNRPDVCLEKYSLFLAPYNKDK